MAYCFLLNGFVCTGINMRFFDDYRPILRSQNWSVIRELPTNSAKRDFSSVNSPHCEKLFFDCRKPVLSFTQFYSFSAITITLQKTGSNMCNTLAENVPYLHVSTILLIDNCGDINLSCTEFFFLYDKIFTDLMKIIIL